MGVGYRGLQLGCFDTITGLNPWKSDKGILGAVSTFGAAQTAITIGAGAAVQGLHGLWGPHLPRAGYETFLGWQFHKLHPLLPDAGLQSRIQGHIQEDVPQVQPQNTVCPVLRGESCVGWIGGS